MTIHMSKKWPEMVVEPDICSQFYIETVYYRKVLSLIVSYSHQVIKINQSFDFRSYEEGLSSIL